MQISVARELCSAGGQDRLAGRDWLHAQQSGVNALFTAKIKAARVLPHIHLSPEKS